MIRLQRTGRKHEPTFRVVVTDSKNSTKSGRSLEVVGSFDPRHGKPQFKTERIKHWLSCGAQPSDTLFNHLVDAKIMEGKKRNVITVKKGKKGAAAPAAPAAAPTA